MSGLHRPSGADSKAPCLLVGEIESHLIVVTVVSFTNNLGNYFDYFVTVVQNIKLFF